MSQKKSWSNLIGKIIRVISSLPLVFLFFHTLVRIIRHIYKFPIPSFLADLIDNPLRRKLMPPDYTAIRQGVRAGMTVLEVGPGNGRYTVAAAQRAGVHGKIIAVDIEPKMIERVSSRAQWEGVKNIEARVANVYDLPFKDSAFDLVYMTAVMGEIPEPLRACREYYRVLKPDGKLVFSEMLMDPDYPLAQTLINLADTAGFRLRYKSGNFFYYTLVFDKLIQTIQPPDIDRVDRSNQTARESYNRLSRWYDRLAGETEWKLVSQGLEKLAVQAGEQVLEIGFGTGRGIIFLANAVGPVGKVFGIDLSEGMLKKAQNRVEKAGLDANVELIQGDALRLPYSNRSMDAVFLSFTLELFDTLEIPLLLQKIKRVLRPGGRLGLVCMAKLATETLPIRLYEWAHRRLPEVVDCRPVYGRALLENAGYEIVFFERQSTWGLPVDIILAKSKN